MRKSMFNVYSQFIGTVLEISPFISDGDKKIQIFGDAEIENVSNWKIRHSTDCQSKNELGNTYVISDIAQPIETSTTPSELQPTASPVQSGAHTTNSLQPLQSKPTRQQVMLTILLTPILARIPDTLNQFAGGQWLHHTNKTNQGQGRSR